MEVWAKFLFLSPLAAATTFYCKPIGAVVEDLEGQDAIGELADLCDEVAQAGAPIVVGGLRDVP